MTDTFRRHAVAIDVARNGADSRSRRRPNNEYSIRPTALKIDYIGYWNPLDRVVTN